MVNAAEFPEISASLEDYLEAIYNIVKKNKVARVKEIAQSLDVKMASVTSALKNLVEKGLVNYNPYSVITLTEIGDILAAKIVRRHRIITSFLTDIMGVDSDEAEENACRMEHVVSKDIIDRLVKFNEFVNTCPRGGKDWIANFRDFYEGACDLVDCREKLGDYIANLQADHDRMSNMARTLDQLTPGQKGKITRIRGRGPVTKRMVDMGFTHGARVEVIGFAPLGDPMEIKIKGYQLSLRREEAQGIAVVLDDEEGESNK